MRLYPARSPQQPRRFLGLPAVLFLGGSNPSHFDTAGQLRHAVKAMIKNPLPQDTILNVNVPDVAITDLKGLSATRLGQRPIGAGHQKRRSAWTDYLRVGPPGAEQDAGPAPTFMRLMLVMCRLRPCKSDLTGYDRIDALKAWLPRGNL